MKSFVDLGPYPIGTISIQDAAKVAKVDRWVIEDALDKGELVNVTFIRRVLATAVTIDSIETWVNARANQRQGAAQ